MWKYIVTWIIVVKTIGACPLPPVKYDEFGREIKRNLELGIACVSYDTTHQEKVFDNRKDAVAFIKRGKESKPNGLRLPDEPDKLQNFKLDSIPAKQYDCPHLHVSITAVWCEPPIPDCNTVTCLKCGKQWGSY